MAEIKPRKNKVNSKKEQIEEMFDSIAPNYDFLNRFLSLRFDVLWRKKLVNRIKPIEPNKVLDIATGTGDVALQISKSINPNQIIGLDLSQQMLAIARVKAAKAGKEIEFMHGDSEKLPFAEHLFDACTVSFGVRNFENLELGLEEMYRVLRPGGLLAVLEFTKPRKFPIKQSYNIYFKYILPLIGRIKSGDPDAYTYLFDSVQEFPEYEQFTAILSKLGFKEISFRPLTFGICTIYLGRK